MFFQPLMCTPRTAEFFLLSRVQRLTSPQDLSASTKTDFKMWPSTTCPSPQETLDCMQKQWINTPSHLVSVTQGRSAGRVAPNPSIGAVTRASNFRVVRATPPTAAAGTAVLTQAAGLTASCLTDRGSAW